MTPDEILHWLYARIMDQMHAERDEARAAERCAVAAWLRADANRVMGTLDPDDRSGYARVYSALHLRADAIERGDHLTPTLKPAAPTE